MMTTMCLYGFVEAWTVPHGCAPVASAAAGAADLAGISSRLR